MTRNELILVIGQVVVVALVVLMVRMRCNNEFGTKFSFHKQVFTLAIGPEQNFGRGNIEG